MVTNLRSLNGTLPASQIRADSGNGHGSTNTKVRRFNNTVIVGTAISYSDSSTAGGLFTIQEDGIYSISYSDIRSDGAAYIGIGINASGTTNVESLSAATRPALSRAPADHGQNVSVTLKLTAGTIVTAHTDGSAFDNSSSKTVFTICQVVRL